MWVAGKTVYCYWAISEHFRDEVHDEALYKLTFLYSGHAAVSIDQHISTVVRLLQ